MTGKLMFVPDTHVVVPITTTEEMDIAGSKAHYKNWDGSPTVSEGDAAIIYQEMIRAAPSLTTPPVLRWKRVDDICSELYVGNKLIATVQQCIDGRWENFMVELEAYKSEDEARRAAENALGLPIVEEL